MKISIKSLSLFFFLIFFICSLQAQNSPSKEKKTQNLTNEISQLQEKIKEERLAIFKAEEEAQVLMFFEWNAYIKKIQEIEKHEDNIIQLKRKLNSLIDQKIEELKQ